MTVAGHHVPVWYNEDSQPADGQIVAWNAVTKRWEATDIDTAAIDAAGLATDAELTAGLATKQDTIPPGTYARAETIFVRDHMPPGWVYGDDGTAALVAAVAAAGTGTVVLPNSRIGLAAEVATTLTGLTIIGEGEKSELILTHADACLLIGGLRTRLDQFRILGDNVATHGLVWAHSSRSLATRITVVDCLSHGVIVDADRRPGGSAGNCNHTQMTKCRSNNNGGDGYHVADSVSTGATSFLLDDCEGNDNARHGALMRHGGWGIHFGHYDSNDGKGIVLGEAGDAIQTKEGTIWWPRVEDNILGTIDEGKAERCEIYLRTGWEAAGYTRNPTGNNFTNTVDGTGRKVTNSAGQVWRYRVDGDTVIPRHLLTANAFGIGSTVVSTGNPSAAFGRKSSATHDRSTAIGYQATTSRADQVVIGATGDETKLGGRLVLNTQIIVTGATPSVAAGSNLLLNNTGATTVTSFADGVDGQVLMIVANNANSTIQHGTGAAGIRLAGAVNWTMPAASTLVLLFSNDRWTEIGRMNAAAQPAGIADVTGGEIIDAEVRTAFNSLLGKLEALGILAVA